MAPKPRPWWHGSLFWGAVFWFSGGGCAFFWLLWPHWLILALALASLVLVIAWSMDRDEPTPPAPSAAGPAPPS